MKKILLIIFLGTLLESCVKINTPGGIVIWGSKETEEINFPLTNFNEILLSDKFQVTINQGENYAVKIRTNVNLKPFLAVEKNYSVLVIKMKPDHFYKDAILEAEVTLPQLIRLDVDGMSQARLEKFTFPHDMKAEISESSKLVGNVDGSRMDLLVKTGSKVDLTGTTYFLKVEGTLSAGLELSEFRAQMANIYLAVGSKGSFLITEKFVAELRNESELEYRGGGQEEKVIVDETSKITKIN
ncbi:MAG: DUF2807 domain-containing protein [Candidatus Marinimicrobia bacterium]|nr:DUF2807 domain-containing protein [Candidatus Neomarinimicrobiota bacterium]